MPASLREWIFDGKGAMQGYRRLARRCGVQWQTVKYWTRKNCVPAKHLAAAEEETGVPRQQLNPLPFQTNDHRSVNYPSPKDGVSRAN